MSLVRTKPLHSLLRNNSCIVNSKWPINCLHPGKFNKLQGSPNTIRISTDDCKIFDATLTIYRYVSHVNLMGAKFYEIIKCYPIVAKMK